MTCRLVVLISGSGTNLQALIDAIAAGRLAATIALVVSNRAAAFGLKRAEQAGIPTLYFPLGPYRNAGQSRVEYDADLAAQIATVKPDLVVLAGWMHIFSATFLGCFPRRVINLHPALPGMFPGLDAIERAYDAYQQGQISHSGCMVHYAIPKVDAGAVITQATVPIYPHDTLDDFTTRLHAVEHHLLVEAVQHVCRRSAK